MVVIYTIIGIILIFADVKFLPEYYQKGLGVMLILYAAVRLYRVKRIFSQPKE